LKVKIKFARIEGDKKLDLLNPSLEPIYKEVHIPRFTSTKRPELFPVKPEHSNPCSFLASDVSELNTGGAT
jgi:hypothetical protein